MSTPFDEGDLQGLVADQRYPTAGPGLAQDLLQGLPLMPLGMADVRWGAVGSDFKQHGKNLGSESV